MPNGIFFYVVGASGVGKDTLISAAMASLAHTGRYVPVRRVITRPAGPGEDHEPVSDAEFDRLMKAGAFLQAWSAHGQRYGLPATIADTLASGRHSVANGSRAALADLVGKINPLVVIEVTAPAAVLHERILGRGRETAKELEERLARIAPIPDGIDVIHGRQ